MWKLRLLVASAALFAFACGEPINNLQNSTAGPRIDSLTIEPDTLSASETGMTDEFFTATLVIAGFEDEIVLDEVEIFIQEPEVAAVPQDATIEGDTIILDQIAKSWFAGLEPEIYDIGASVESETESIRELNLTTITVTE